MDANQIAGELCGAGLSIIPILPGPSKRPDGPWKLAQTVRATAEAVAAKLAAGRNIGIVTGAVSGVVVLDVDRHAADGEATLAAVLALHGGLPITVEARTGGGGRHLYFRHPGYDCRNKAAFTGGGFAWLPGLDFRGDGGYVVAPPSLHHSGAEYTWTRRPGEAPFAPLPAWLAEILQQLQDGPFEPPAWLQGIAQPLQGHAETPPAPPFLPQPAPNTPKAPPPTRHVAPGSTIPAPTGPTPAPAADTATTVGPGYAPAILDRGIAEIQAAPVGARNNTLNRVALDLASLARDGLLAEADVRDSLVGAVERGGWNADADGWRQTMATIDSAFDASRRGKKPRKVRLAVAPEPPKAPAPAGALDVRHPDAVARAYAAFHFSGGRLRRYRQSWRRYGGGLFGDFPEPDLRAHLRAWLECQHLARGESAIHTTINVVNETLAALEAACNVQMDRPAPIWLEKEL